MSKRPHVLVLMTDQQRADCLSCAGHPVVRTPNMDWIAEQGVRFANTYTPSPICMPARSSALSGQYAHNHGQWHNYGHLPAEADTYLRHLKRVGYRTCHIGKSHLYVHQAGHHLNDHLGFMRALGWDDVLETTGPWATVATDSIATDHWQRIGCLDTFRNDYNERRKVASECRTQPSPMPEGETLDDFVGRTAVDYINDYRRSEPLTLFVGFGGPHEPWDPPASWAQQYDPQAMPPALPPVSPGPWVPEKAARWQESWGYVREMIPEQIGLVRARYYAKISHIDSWFGRILDAYKQRGWLDDTAIVFWSDHGEMLGDKARLHKSVLYDSAAKVPLIVRRPGERNAGAVAAGLASLVDLFPTVLELGGCEAKESVFGRSLAARCDCPNAPGHDAVFSEIEDLTMVRDERAKMVIDRSGDTLLLHDLADDPDENVNLAGKPDAAETERRLRERLLRWHLETRSDQRLA